MDSHSNKVLITGIAGFTGKYLSEYFISLGYEVFGLVNKENPSEKNHFHCDLLEKERLVEIIDIIKPNIIIHLAAISFVGHQKVEDFYQVNVIGTQNLLEALKPHRSIVKKVILASSATVYGNQDQYERISEQQCANPNNHYGISKYAMEQVAKNYFELLPIIITRPFNYTGQGQSIHFVIPKITEAFKEKKAVLELGNTNVFREYNSIDFLIECYYKLAISDVSSEIVNICSGVTYSLDEVIRICSDLTNHEVEIKVNANFVRKNDIYKLSGDPTKLKTMVAVDQIRNDLIKTLRSFL